MVFKLRSAVEDDCVHISRITQDAFPDMSEILFPEHLRTSENKDDEVKWRADRTLNRLRQGMPTVVAVEVDETSGAERKVVGFSQWKDPRPSEPSLQIDQGVPLPSGIDKAKSDEIVRVIHDQEARILCESASDTWICLLLAIDPAYQRRGLGTLVLRWGLDQAEAEGKRAFLTSSPEGKPLYLAQGMREVGVDIVWGNKPHYAMITGRQCST